MLLNPSSREHYGFAQVGGKEGHCGGVRREDGMVNRVQGGGGKVCMSIFTLRRSCLHVYVGEEIWKELMK